MDRRHTLERAGSTTVLQAWDFRPGENFIQRMNEALAAATRAWDNEFCVFRPNFPELLARRRPWTS